MTVLPIATVGDPVLREQARELSTEELRSDEVQRLIDDMIETKRAAHGAGLAANQVGRALRVAVVEVDPDNPRYPYKPPVDLTVIVNPTVEATSIPPLARPAMTRVTNAMTGSPSLAKRFQMNVTTVERAISASLKPQERYIE